MFSHAFTKVGKTSMRLRDTVSPEETFMDTKNLPGFDTARFEGILERPIRSPVFLLVGSIFFLVSVLLTVRAGYLTLVEGGAYAMRAEHNRLRHSTIVPERGVIYDRNGKSLAYNVPGFRVVVDTRQADPALLMPLVEELAVALGRDTAEFVLFIERHWENGEIVVELMRDWDIASKLTAEFKDTDAIRVEPTPLRAYDGHPAFGHVIGYVSRVTKEDVEADSAALLWGEAGRSGIERSYDAQLRGVLGVKIVETDSQSAVLSEGTYQQEERGESLILSISSDLQKVVYEAIQRTAEERGFGGGSAVVLDARTGAVLSIVSYPGFDLNVMSTGTPRDEVVRLLSDSRHPLFSRTVTGLYPPASTIKPFLAAAAIEEHVISPERVIYTEGRIVVPNPFDPDHPSIFKDWKNHGPVDMIRAIAVSSDAYFYTIGGGDGAIDGLGVERMYDYMRRFGMGQKTGIDLTGEEEGFVPNKEWKARMFPDDPLWRVGDSYNMSIGQGWLLITPLQLARAVLAIANKGELLQPYLVQTVSRDGDADISEHGMRPASRSVSVSDSSLAKAREGMRAAVVEGTALGVNPINPPVAAKTGTAQFDKPGRVHSWFMGYIPFQEPELVLVVNMENGPSSNLIGATYVAHEILQWYTQGGRKLVWGDN